MITIAPPSSSSPQESEMILPQQQPGATEKPAPAAESLTKFAAALVALTNDETEEAPALVRTGSSQVAPEFEVDERGDSKNSGQESSSWRRPARSGTASSRRSLETESPRIERRRVESGSPGSLSEDGAGAKLLARGNSRVAPMAQASVLVPLSALTRTLTAGVRAGAQEIEIRLDPPELGALQVRVRVHERTVFLTIRYEIAATASKVLAQVSSLRADFSRHGLTLGTLQLVGGSGKAAGDSTGQSVTHRRRDENRKRMDRDSSRPTLTWNGSRRSLDMMV